MNRFSYTRHRRWLRAEQLEDRLLLAIDFVADINTVPRNRLPTESVAVDGELYFQAFDPINGSELWKSDGTPEGTVLAHNISRNYIGERADSNPSLLTSVNSSAYFIADETFQGGDSDVTYSRIWSLDPGADELGVVHSEFIADTFGPGHGFDVGIRQSQLTSVDDTLFFLETSYRTHNTILMRVRPGEQVEIPIQDAGLFYFSELTNSGESLFFSARTRDVGQELWKISPADDGVTLVKDIAAGRYSSRPKSLTDVDGTLFFVTGTANEPWTLWKSDGSEPGTVPIGEFLSEPTQLTRVGDKLFYVVDDERYGPELWVSDQNAAGASLVRDIVPGEVGSSPLQLTAVGERLYFQATDAEHGTELWSTDGTQQGTSLARDINPGVSSSNPWQLFESDGTLYFQADDGAHGNELWKSDGTAEGTLLVSGLSPGILHSNLHPFGSLTGKLFFGVENGSDLAIWSTDGSRLGTQQLLEYQVATKESELSWPLAVGESLYFVAHDGLHDWEIWTSDGTAGNTYRVTDLVPETSTQRPFLHKSIGDTLFFTAGDTSHGAELWKTDGTALGTSLVKDISPGDESTFIPSTIVFGDELFLSLDDQVHGRELWKSDGTTEGTVLLKDIVNESDGSYPGFLKVVDDLLYFAAWDPVHGNELWVTDGTVDGTVMVKDIYEGERNSNPVALSVAGGLLYFRARDSEHGDEVWVTDGTTEGTRLLVDATPGTPNSLVRSYVVDDQFYFTANDALWISDGTSDGTQLLVNLPERTSDVLRANGNWFFATDTQSKEELWISDGTNEGTHIIFETVFRIGRLATLEHLVFFTSYDEQHGSELWVTDGSSDGTRVIDFVPGELGSAPYMLTSVHGELLVSAADKLWRTDGTIDGTTIISPELDYSDVESVTQIGESLFFTARDPLNGRELWKLDLPFSGDFDSDGKLHVEDIDLLVRNIAEQTDEVRFDLNGDGLVNSTDMTRWLAVAGRDNGLNAPYSPGDANLDGVVDTQDFAIWNANRFTSEAAWSRGDFNADGVVDGSDFNVWLKNRFERVPPAVAANAKRLVRPVRQAAMPSQIDHIVMFSTASRSALRQQFGSKSGDPFYVTPDSVFVTANTPVGKRHVLQWNAPRQRREISNEAKAELIDIVLANDSLRPNADTLSHISQHELDIFLLSIFLSNYGIGQEYW